VTGGRAVMVGNNVGVFVDGRAVMVGNNVDVFVGGIGVLFGFAVCDAMIMGDSCSVDELQPDTKKITIRKAVK
jgi:hypothetical protein